MSYVSEIKNMLKAVQRAQKISKLASKRSPSLLTHGTIPTVRRTIAGNLEYGAIYKTYKPTSVSRIKGVGISYKKTPSFSNSGRRSTPSFINTNATNRKIINKGKVAGAKLADLGAGTIATAATASYLGVKTATNLKRANTSTPQKSSMTKPSMKNITAQDLSFLQIKPKKLVRRPMPVRGINPYM